MDDSPYCRNCGTTENVREMPFSVNGANPVLCGDCYRDTMNNVKHKCRGCGREDVSRLTGMHTTPLEPDGTLQMHDRQVREGRDEPWHPEPDFISRVICADCCPAQEHDVEPWCTIMSPVESW